LKRLTHNIGALIGGVTLSGDLPAETMARHARQHPLARAGLLCSPERADS